MSHAASANPYIVCKDVRKAFGSHEVLKGVSTVFRTGEVTVAMGDLSLMQQGRLKLSYLSDESGLVNGDLLLTSGLGGYYPSGLGIGSVEEVRTDDNGLTKYAVIAPLVDMNQLTEVFVITDFDIVD